VYRVVITTSEVYDNLIIECLTIGEESGNVKIVSRRKVDLESIWSSFHFNGEISGLEFVKWLNPNSFSFKIHNKILVFKDIGSANLKVPTK
jgi:Ni,Fe-hydrogenase maturation factor